MLFSKMAIGFVFNVATRQYFAIFHITSPPKHFTTIFRGCEATLPTEERLHIREVELVEKHGSMVCMRAPLLYSQIGRVCDQRVGTPGVFPATCLIFNITLFLWGASDILLMIVICIMPTYETYLLDKHIRPYIRQEFPKLFQCSLTIVSFF